HVVVGHDLGGLAGADAGIAGARGHHGAAGRRVEVHRQVRGSLGQVQAERRLGGLVVLLAARDRHHERGANEAEKRPGRAGEVPKERDPVGGCAGSRRLHDGAAVWGERQRQAEVG
ncbi:MAG: hypothetical protein EBV07_01605, partial [Proteobacteria bacterium]|nr:hypothetical protein [Pseudomonadota bacterium]